MAICNFARGLRLSATICCDSCSTVVPRASESSVTEHLARGTRCSTTAVYAAICSSHRYVRNPYKHGRFTPGTRIPIHDPAQIDKDRPDVVLALPWNLEPELTEQLAYIAEWAASWSFRSRSCTPRPSRTHPNNRRYQYVVVLFCGGYGMRMRNGSGAGAPKPMQMVGQRPLIWHVMRYYAHFAPERIHSVRRLRRVAHQEFLPDVSGRRLQRLRHARRRESNSTHFDISDWSITFVDTGLESAIGERLRRVRHLLAGDEYFLANYADVLTDAPLDHIVEKFHEAGAQDS